MVKNTFHAPKVRRKRQTKGTFIDMVNTMNDTRAFSLLSLRRTISPYVSTTLKGDYLTLTSRETGKKVSIKFVHYHGILFANVYWSSTFFYDVTFDFSLSNNKTFLHKLLNQNLL